MTLALADQPRILSLCTGYGGLTRAVEHVTGGRTIAVADIEPGPRKVLAHRFPGIPNLGDITTVDWRDWAGRVDVIEGGTPCQSVSLAGQRKGMHDGTQSNLWVAMRDAIAVIRPRLVAWENVGGAYSACAASDLGCCPRCVGETDTGRHAPVLRAVGRVLGDLSALGYDAQWVGIRASDVGAPHRRLRVFVTAHPNGERRQWVGGARDGWTGPADGGGGPLKLLPTPRAARGGSATETMTLLPTSAGVGIRPSLDTLGTDPGRWGKYAHAIARWEAILGRPAPEPTTPVKKSEERCAVHGDSKEGRPQEELPDVRRSAYPQALRKWTTGGSRRVLAADALLPVVREQQGVGKEGYGALAGQEASRGRMQDVRDDDAFARSSHRQEPDEQRSIEPDDALRKLPPKAALEGGPLCAASDEPVVAKCTCKSRLSPAFCEWMMGCPDGWVTSTPGVGRSEALRMLGNGVVEQQATAALRHLATVAQEAA